MPFRPISFVPLIGCFVFLLSASAAETSLEDGFRQPPDSAKPRTWWHWVSGNVSSEGITADLKAMKQIGLGGAQIFSVDQSVVKGPVQFMSPEWRKLVHQALTEAADLHLEIAMEGCDGWSESGGHWVTGAQAMQKVVWTEETVDGGHAVTLDLPQPETRADYYEDIAVLAFPARAGDGLPEPSQITASAPDFSPGKTTFGPFHVKHPDKSAPLWLQFGFPASIRIGSMDLASQAIGSHNPGTLQASDDGVTFHDVTKLPREGFITFPPATGKYFRIVYAIDVDGGVQVGHVRFGGVRLSNALARAGMLAMNGLPFDTDKTPVEPDDVIDPKTLVDLTGQKQWNAPPGKWTIMRFGHTATGGTTHPSSTPGLECDKLSEAAVESHIANMFGPVWADSPQQTGSTFHTIVLDSWEAGCANWTERMPLEFKARHGYELKPWLPTLAGRIVGDVENSERFQWDFRRTIADLLAENHYGTFQKEAHAHGMTLASEAPGIGTPTVADDLLCKKYTDIPMGEFWVSNGDSGNIDDPKEAASAAHIYGKAIAATESFTSTPTSAAWTNDPYSLKRLGDFEFCLGINRFVFHRYAHQPWLDRWPGMSMGPWGINFERTNTWWNEGAPWIGYLTRCEYLLQQGRPVADMLYFYGEGAPANVGHERIYPHVPVGSDYDVCNADVIMNDTSVENGEIVLKSGMRYRLLSLRPDRMTLPLVQKVAELVKEGATVYSQRPGQSPSLSGPPDADAQIATLADEVWGKNTAPKQHTYGAGRVVWDMPLESLLGPPDFAAALPNVLFAHRRDAGTDLYFVSNQSDQDRVVDCTFRVDGKVPELWHPDTGKMETAAIYTSANGRTTLPVHFDPYGSVFVVFRKQETKADHPISMVRADTGTDSSAPSHLQILKATYGATDDSHSKDVTAPLTALVQNGVLDVEVGNAAFGGDPAPKAVKQLHVDYVLDGKPGSQTLKEGEMLLIAPPQAFYPDSTLLVDEQNGLELEAAHAGTYNITMAGGETKPVSVAAVPAPTEVTGTWTLDFPPKWGAPSQITLDRLASWTDNPDPGVKYFSGTATYRCAMTVPSDFLGDGRRVYLDLGKVKNLAEVAINGKPLGILWKAPFRIDVTDAVKSGSNQLEIKVTNLWPNRLIGDLQLPEDKHLTWTNVSLYTKDSPLLASGLLGPVELIPTQRIPIANTHP